MKCWSVGESLEIHLDIWSPSEGTWSKAKCTPKNENDFIMRGLLLDTDWMVGTISQADDEPLKKKITTVARTWRIEEVKKKKGGEKSNERLQTPESLHAECSVTHLFYELHICLLPVNPTVMSPTPPSLHHRHCSECLSVFFYHLSRKQTNRRKGRMWQQLIQISKVLLITVAAKEEVRCSSTKRDRVELEVVLPT